MNTYDLGGLKLRKLKVKTMIEYSMALENYSIRMGF